MLRDREVASDVEGWKVIDEWMREDRDVTIAYGLVGAWLPV